MKSPLQVTGIDHVVFHVKDLARAKKFYVDFLGMEVDHERSWQCFLKCGNQGLALFEAKDGAEIHGGSEVHGRDGDPHCIYFHDPDGHQLQLLMPKN